MEFYLSLNAESKMASFASTFVKISLLKSSKSTIHPSQFLRFLKEVLVKSGTLHLKFFKLQDIGKILACVDSKDSITIFQLPVSNTVQLSLGIFLTPKHLSRNNSFSCNCQTIPNNSTTVFCQF